MKPISPTPASPTSWTTIVFRDENRWVGWIAQIPGVNAQGHTREELLDTLSEVLREALEMNRRDALAYASDDHEAVTVVL